MSNLAAVYIRMSTNKQDDSPEQQRTMTSKAIQKENLTLYKEYLDEGWRGWDDNRPQFRQLLADAQAKKFQVIVVDEVSRLSRKEVLEFFAEVARPLQKAGVRLYSVAEGGFQNWDQLVGVILSAVHQDNSSGESKKTARRVTRDYLTMSASGRIDLGKPPYGYRRIWEDHTGNILHEGTHPPETIRRLKPISRLVPGEPSEVDVVRFIFDAYANRDMSLRDIGRDLTNRGVLTPAGLSEWSQNCVGKILREEKYTGSYVFNRRHEGKYCRLGVEDIEPSVAKGVKPVQNPRVAWRVIPRFHEPLISPKVFQRVQELLNANRTRTTPSPNRGDYLLNGILVCDACGSPMSGHRNGKNSPAFYRCTRAMGTAQNRCFNNIVKESEVVDSVIASIEDTFLSPTFLALLREEAGKLDQDCVGIDRVKNLQSELATLDRNISQTQNRLAKVDDETFDFLNGELAKWRARRKTILAELEEANRPSHTRRADEFVAGFESLVRGLRSSLTKRDRNRTRSLLREMLDCVRVRVERRLVGKTRHRYFLLGGDIIPRTKGSERKRRRRQGEKSEVRYLSTEKIEKERASVSLSCAEPRACPR
jgi:DNA invertase Pin-like site-specific DNA recombinase